MAAPVHYVGTFCELSIAPPAPGVAVVTIAGHDVGEFGSAPMSHLEKHLSGERPLDLYIDARRTKGASIEVSGGWAMWLAEHRSRFTHVSMLTGSRFIEVTAGFVRSFSGLENVMRLYTDAAAFEEALAASVAEHRHADPWGPQVQPEIMPSVFAMNRGRWQGRGSTGWHRSATRARRR